AQVVLGALQSGTFLLDACALGADLLFPLAERRLRGTDIRFGFLECVPGAQLLLPELPLPRQRFLRLIELNPGRFDALAELLERPFSRLQPGRAVVDAGSKGF